MEPSVLEMQSMLSVSEVDLWPSNVFSFHMSVSEVMYDIYGQMHCRHRCKDKLLICSTHQSQSESKGSRNISTREEIFALF